MKLVMIESGGRKPNGRKKREKGACVKRGGGNG